MKTRFKIIACLNLFALLLTGCGASNENGSSGGGSSGGGGTNPPVENTYTITWKNWNGNVLETDTNVKEGTMPTYDGATPTRPDDDEYTYTWSGWTPEVTLATSNQTYTATYSYERLTTTYTINFDLNGGTSESYTGSKTVEAFSKSIFFFDCVKEGWNFRGWSYNGTKIFDEKGNQLANPVMAKTMTFVAMYAQTAKLTIVSNLEGAGNITGEGEYPYNTYVDVSAYANQGYKFIGWYYQNTLLSNTNDYKYMMWSEDVTLEARFELDSFLMNIHTNNSDYGLVLLRGTINNDYQAQYEEYRDYTTTIAIAAYSKTDVRFLGWYDTDNRLVETNAVYNFVMPNHDYTLEAKWNYFTVTYNLNGGSNDSSNPTSYTIDTTTGLTLHEPTRIGYDFLGWRYKGNYVTEINPSWIENITLEAIWRAHTYSISYELNGGTNNSNNPTSYTIESNTITLLDPSRFAYTFSGWYRTASFSNKVTQITKGSYEDLTLYAKWTPVSYSITYNLNGGTNASSNPSTYTIESAFTFASPSKTGYTFLGWFDENGNQITNINAGTTGALKLTANWNDGDTYNVVLNADGGETSETSIKVQYNKSYALPIPTKAGYTFDGWYSGSIRIANNGTWKYDYIDTLSAHWIIINYQIKYNSYYYTTNNNPTSYTVEDTIVFEDLSCAGYTFLGWFDSNDALVKGIEKGTIGDKVFTAHWNDGNDYTIYLDYNGGEGGEETIKIKFNTSYALPIPTRTGYTFDGWCRYDYNYTLPNSGTYNYTEDVYLTAKWKANSYKVSLEVTEMAFPQTYKVTFLDYYGKSWKQYTVSETNPLVHPGPCTASAYKNGWRQAFVGWYKDETCTDFFDFTVPLTCDTTVYSGWTEHCSSSAKYIDVTKYYDPIRQYKVQNLDNGTQYFEFTALKSQSARFYYMQNMSGSNYSVKFRLRSTTGSFDKTVTSTNNVFQSYSLNLEKGKLYQLQISRVNSSYTPSAYFYFTGITYSDDGAIPERNSTYITKEIIFGDDYTFSHDYTRNGYTFLGYFDKDGRQYTDEEGNGLSTWNVAEDITLYAHWLLNSYTITYNLDGGNNNPSNPSTYTVEDNISLLNPDKTGCTFDGWYLDENYTKPINQISNGNHYDNLVLYAKWIPNS